MKIVPLSSIVYDNVILKCINIFVNSELLFARIILSLTQSQFAICSLKYCSSLQISFISVNSIRTLTYFLLIFFKRYFCYIRKMHKNFKEFMWVHLAIKTNIRQLWVEVLDKNNSEQSLRWRLISKFHQTCLSS